MKSYKRTDIMRDIASSTACAANRLDPVSTAKSDTSRDAHCVTKT